MSIMFSDLQKEKKRRIIRSNYATPYFKSLLKVMPADVLITQNYYGADILNVKDIFIADVDTDEKEEYFAFFTEVIIPMYEHLTFVLYETHSGFRIFIVNRYYNPSSLESSSLLRTLCSDEMYIEGCEQQKCYRARLTPKPTRIGLLKKPKDTSNWEEIYREASKGFKVCEKKFTYGKRKAIPWIQAVINIHDSYTLPSNNDALFA